MSEDVKFEPVGKVEMFSEGSEPRFESKNAAAKRILERVRSSLYISDNAKSELADLLSSVPDVEKGALVGELTSSLQSRYYVQRANAICVLGLLGSQARSAVCAIIQAMDCWNCKIAMQAAEALPKIGASEAVPALARALHKIPQPEATSLAWSDQDENIVHCLQVLGPSASGAAPQLAAYLHFIRRTSHGLISIGASAIPAVLNELQRATAKRSSWVCSIAAEIFSAIGSDASQPLINALETSTPDKRLRIAMVFSQLMPPALTTDAIPVLRRLLGDPSVGNCARQALETLKCSDVVADDAINRVLAFVRRGRYLLHKSASEIGILDSLTQTEKETVAGQLIALLKSDKQIEQINALYMLGLLGPHARSAVPAMIEALDRMDCSAVMQAADTLSKIGASYAVPELIAALPQAAQSTRVSSLSRKNERVMECLEVFGPSLSSHAPFLAAFLGTRSANTVLSNLGAAAVPAVLEEVAQAGLQKSLSWTCQAAAEVLSSIGSPANQPLIDALESSTLEPSTKETREAISLLFSYLRPPALSMTAAPALSRLLLDEAPNVGSNARRALVALGGLAAPAVFDNLSGHLTSTTPGQRQGKRVLDGLLKEYGTAAIPALTARFPDLDPMAQANLGAAILRMDAYKDDAAEQLLALLRSDSAKVRAMAVQAVADARSSAPGPVVGLLKDKLLPAVGKAWQDPDSSVRRQAAGVLTALVPHEMWGKLLASVAIAKSSGESKEYNRALEHLATRLTDDFEQTSDEERLLLWEQVSEVLRGLGTLCDSSRVRLSTALTKASQDPNPAVREAAAALKKFVES